MKQPTFADVLRSEARLTFGHRAAQQMWFRKGLETVPAMYEPGAQPDLFRDGGSSVGEAA